MNPLDWTGPQFLMLYLPLLLVGIVAAMMLRGFLRTPGGDPRLVGARLDLATYELALLQGAQGPVHAAVAALVHVGALRIESGMLKAGLRPSDPDPIERAVWLAVLDGKTTPAEVSWAVREKLKPLEQRLVGKGLLLDAEPLLAAWLLPAALHGLVLTLGIAKLVVGSNRHKPVGFLIVLVMVGVMALILFLALKPRRSRLGDATLKALAQKHEALRTSVSSEGSKSLVSGKDMALAVGLFGATALSNGAFTELREFLAPPGSGGDGGGGSSCGGGSCGGGGCGGCGGGD